MFSDCRPNVGFLGGNVGSMSGFFEEPDIDCFNITNDLRHKCRECRVLLGVETSHKSENFARNTTTFGYLADLMGLE